MDELLTGTFDGRQHLRCAFDRERVAQAESLSQHAPLLLARLLQIQRGLMKPLGLRCFRLGVLRFLDGVRKESRRFFHGLSILLLRRQPSHQKLHCLAGVLWKFCLQTADDRHRFQLRLVVLYRIVHQANTVSFTVNGFKCLAGRIQPAEDHDRGFGQYGFRQFGPHQPLLPLLLSGIPELRRFLFRRLRADERRLGFRERGLGIVTPLFDRLTLLQEGKLLFDAVRGVIQRVAIRNAREACGLSLILQLLFRVRKFETQALRCVIELLTSLLKVIDGSRSIRVLPFRSCGKCPENPSQRERRDREQSADNAPRDPIAASQSQAEQGRESHAQHQRQSPGRKTNRRSLTLLLQTRDLNVEILSPLVAMREIGLTLLDLIELSSQCSISSLSVSQPRGVLILACR